MTLGGGYMSEESMLVYCVHCQNQFKMSMSLIKEINEYKKPVLYEKYRCPFCNKNHKYYCDPTVNHTDVINELESKYAEEERLKAQQPISCPKCNSTQLYAGEKGFSTGKALLGSAIFGGVGLLAGTLGSKQVMLTCLSCGHKCKAGE